MKVVTSYMFDAEELVAPIVRCCRQGTSSEVVHCRPRGREPMITGLASEALTLVVVDASGAGR